MKQIKYISRYLFFVVILYCGISCGDYYVDDNAILPPDTYGNMVDVPLYTNGDEFEIPVTRATDENNTQGYMPWVLVFRGDNNSAVFYEASRAKIANGKLSVTLSKSATKSRLLIIANPSDKFFDGATNNLNMDKSMLTAKLSGKTYSQALTILNTQKLNSPQTKVPYIEEYLPMSTSIVLNSIDNLTTIGTPTSKIQLIRIVAKVTVENSAPDFVVEGFTVIGAKQYGRYMYSAPAIAIGNKVDYFASSPLDPVVGISDGKKPIYVYDSAAGETSVIVKGNYKSVIGYYHLVFKNNNNVNISVVRNKWYQFKIKDVTLQGYKTLQEAVASKPSNIVVELLVTDQNSMEISDNGHYYIGLTNSVFYAYSNSAHSNLVAATITTNAPSGVKASVGVVSVEPASSMTVSPINIVPDGTVKGVDAKISVTKQFKSGTLIITVGNLMRMVTVERKPILTWRENSLTFTPNYTSAKIESQGNGGNEWITVSADGVNYTEPQVVRPYNSGSVYLRVSENNSGVSRDQGVVYLARKGSEGHVKLFINQISISPR